MSAKTLTKDELVSAVAEKTGLTHAKTHETIQSLLETMQTAFQEGRKVEFRNFGVFRVMRRKERKGRNPADPSAGTFTIPPRNVVKFKTGGDLDRAINQSA